MRARAGAAVVLLALLAGSARAAGDLDDLVAKMGKAATRSAAFGELRRRRDPKAIPLLVRAMPGWDWVGQAWGCLLVAEAGGADARPAFRELMMSGAPFLRVAAGAQAFRLGDSGGALAVADGLLADEVAPAVRIQMLARCYTVAVPAVQTAMGALLRKEKDAGVRSWVLYALAYQDAGREASSVEAVLGAPETGIRALAAALLVSFGREEHAEALAAAIEKGGIGAAEWVRIDYVLRHRSERIPKPVREAMGERLRREKDEKELVRLLGYLAAWPYPPARDAIEARLADERKDVALAAFDALLAMPGALPPERLLPLLEGRPDSLRLRAADALRRQDDRAGLATVSAILARGAPGDRAAAAEVLGRFVAAAAVDPLLDALLDPEKEVRAAAATALADVLTALLPYRRLNLGRIGYDATQGPGANVPAVTALREWWTAARSRDW